MRLFLDWVGALVGYFTRTLDWPLLLALGALMGIGLAVLQGDMAAEGHEDDGDDAAEMISYAAHDSNR